jgi:DNA-binding response OmpR family regulator
MRRIDLHLDDLIVVDANLNDYAGLLTEICRYELRVRLFSTGEDALRVAGARHATLWVVNIRLPDMSGISLLRLIRRRLRRSSIVIAGDTYSEEDELAARSAGATAYMCKPPTVAWLGAFQLRCREPAVRSVTENEPGSVAALRPP